MDSAHSELYTVRHVYLLARAFNSEKEMQVSNDVRVSHFLVKHLF